MSRKLVQLSLATAVVSTIGGYSLYKNGGETQCDSEDKWSKVQNNNSLLKEAIKNTERLCERVKNESGTPGLVISVSVDGVPVYQNGFGFADVENHIVCNSNTVMRIASISKSMTMAVAAKLWQEGQLSFDKPIQDYVPDFPVKVFEGEKVEITLRHLVSHLSGIRHYEKVVPLAEISEVKIEETEKKAKPQGSEFENQEYLINTYFNSVSKSLSLFQDDELFSKPGTKFLYTTHGWTLVSAVIENAVKKPFPEYMKTFFREMGLKNTYLDENKPIIYNRARYYVRNEKGRLENAPLVDNSYKWAGGGFLSTSEDLVKFGNAMLYSFQNFDGFLSNPTAKMIWSPVANTSLAWDKDGQYGMGWGVVPAQTNHPFCKSRQFYVTHTGGAIGASSVLLVLPKPKETTGQESPVRGVVVSMIANLQNVGLNQTALEIAQNFETVSLS